MGCVGDNVISVAIEGVRQGLGLYYWVAIGEKPCLVKKIIVLGSKYRRGLVMYRLGIKAVVSFSNL